MTQKTIRIIRTTKRKANKLLDKVMAAIEKRKDNPLGYEKYKGKIHFKYDWYRIYVENFTIFYTVRKNTI